MAIAHKKEIAEAERRRDEAIQEMSVVKDKLWRALNVLAAINDLRTGSPSGTINDKQLVDTWNQALEKRLTEPPSFSLQGVEEVPQISDWDLDIVAAKIDPGAFLDDSIVIGSVVQRRFLAREKAMKLIVENAKHLTQPS